MSRRLRCLTHRKPPEINVWSPLLFYHVSKIAWFLFEPSNLLAFLLLAAVLLIFTRMARFGRRLGLGTAMLLLVFGLSPAGNWLILPLEMRFPVPDLSGRTIDGIIVLGGAVQERQTLAHGPLAMNDAGERVVAMADLARRYPAARVVFTGGAGAYSAAPKPEAEVVREQLTTLGLATDRVLFETESLNTHENAILTKAMVKPAPGETWLLVTSAWHMPRSVGIFRKAGFSVVAYPVDFRTAGWQDSLRPFASVSDGLRRTDLATREWIGLIVYRLTGKGAALFPAP
jgi:uncharacterized SAM-binding protein YcdF (DUF218 family)